MLSSYFCVSFSRERKSERIKRTFETQNPYLREPYSVVQLLAERLDLPKLLKLEAVEKMTTYDICEAWADKRGYVRTHHMFSRILHLYFVSVFCEKKWPFNILFFNILILK